MSEVIKIDGAGGICNTYLISNGKESVIIDPGGDYGLIKHQIGNTQLKAILVTHGHYDHIVHVARLVNEYSAPFYIHSSDSKLIKHANLYIKAFNGKHPIEIPGIDKLITNERELDFGFITLKVLHTPGHTEGSVCYFFENSLFTGDTLLKNKIGRTDFPGGSEEKLRISLKKINAFIPDGLILPGHRANSSLDDERNNNKAYFEIINN